MIIESEYSHSIESKQVDESHRLFLAVIIESEYSHSIESKQVDESHRHIHLFLP